MEQIKKVKMAIKLGLTSILETFWAIGTSTVARDVLLMKKHENTTLYIANKADRGLLCGGSSLEHRRSFCFGYLKNISAVPKQKLRLSANLIGLFSEMPYLPYTQR